MSGLKNSPFGKRLRASHKEATSHHNGPSGSNPPTTDDEDQPRRTRPRLVNPIFGISPASGPASTSNPFGGSTPSLESRHNSSNSEPSSNGPVSPIDLNRATRGFPTPSRTAKGKGRVIDYGDRFVPSRDSGDIRTSYHLMDEGGGAPSTPSKNRIIPSESDALKEQANAIFTSILHTEVTPPSPHRSASPTRNNTTSTSNASGGGGASSSTSSLVPPSTPTRRRLFTYHSPSKHNSNGSGGPSTPTRRLDDPTDEAYSMSPVRAESRLLLESPRRQLRSVCKTPYRVLDAPDLADDFYLNLVDWSSTNVLGVGLGSCVYLWTAHNAQVSKLCDLAESNDTVSSVSWVQKGTTLAVGTLNGRVHIYDASTLQLLRTYNQAHAQRIGALAWNTHVLSSGSRDRNIYHRDVRESSQRPFRRCAGHRQEVCGLKWSNGPVSGSGGLFGGGSGDGGGGIQGAMLASGGNDNKVCIWDLRGSRRAAGHGSGHRSTGSMSGITGLGTGRLGGGPSGSSGSEDNTGINNGNDVVPLWKFHEHTAAVKALAWDPHVSGVLATGGGTQDKHIRFWNTANGTMLNELDTGSQVCNLIWSLTSHELVSTHGFSSTTAQNQICIWKYPTLNMVASLTGHTNRVLYLAMSPDGETIVTGAGDETLRFWNAFPNANKDGKSGGSPAKARGGGESRLDWGKLIR